MFGLSKKDKFISAEKYNETIQVMLKSFLDVNVIIMTWAAGVEKAAQDSKNAAVIKFAEASLLSLKKEFAIHMQKNNEILK